MQIFSKDIYFFKYVRYLVHLSCKRVEFQWECYFYIVFILKCFGSTDTLFGNFTLSHMLIIDGILRLLLLWLYL